MIEVTNRKEFFKCCELMNSIDKESRSLGWSLIQGCIEIPENLYIRVITSGFINTYEFIYYMQKRLLVESDIKPGILLHDLIFKRIYKYHDQSAILFIKDDQSN